MKKFDEVLTQVEDPSSLDLIGEGEINAIKKDNPGLPSDYTDFLSEIGHGDLGVLIVYDAPMAPSEVYPHASADALNGIVLFGDDMQGYCYGFDLNDAGRVVELDPAGSIDRSVESGFIDFLKAFLNT